jgi:nucleoid DNA-binding protein
MSEREQFAARVAAHLADGEAVHSELGRFFVLTHAGFVGRNPATGKRVEIKPVTRRYFVPADELLAALGKKLAAHHRRIMEAVAESCDEGLYDRESEEPVLDFEHRGRLPRKGKRVAAAGCYPPIVQELKRHRRAALPGLGCLVVHEVTGELLTGDVLRCLFD